VVETVIISKIRGGLGNQLFEWAAGYALSRFHDAEFKVDLEVYARNKARDFELRSLGLRINEASELEVTRLQNTHFYRQPHYHFDTGFYGLSDDTYLRGYFCSHRYFDFARDEVRQLLWQALCSRDINTEQQARLDVINNCQSISLHIRRGDYVSNAGYNEFFGTCSIEYYQRAVHRITGSNRKAEFKVFVFSDDLNWCRDHLLLDQEMVFVDVNSDRDGFYDMMFMARCHHNVIANSTYSWWAAWLNENPDKIVVAPEQWFRTTYREKTKGAWIADPVYDLKDMFPESWSLM